MNNFSSEPVQWVEIFWRRDLHKCNCQVTFLIQLKRNALVKYWLTDHQNHTNVFFRQVVVLTWWSCWSLENEFFLFQVGQKCQEIGEK